MNNKMEDKVFDLLEKVYIELQINTGRIASATVREGEIGFVGPTRKHCTSQQNLGL